MKGTEAGSGTKNRREGIRSPVLFVKAYRCLPKHTHKHTHTYTHTQTIMLVLIERPHSGEVLHHSAQEKVSGLGGADG